ncbi:FecR family protein [Sphingobacterium sp. SYP-B4668]|uniref:FecR family protein n=1 Tax=Sphingobacterium sp. SYP-B4668 TaxID=2996035 RepID=UPI0022DE94FC|nr:FecR family protein [Sphingobacterium sp. SYP-B4668]
MERDKFYISVLIQRYLQGQLTQEEARAFDTWLLEDAKNQALVHQFRNAKHLEGDLNFIHAIDSDNAWEQFQKKEFKKSRTRYYRYASIVAVLLVCFCASWFWMNSPDISNEKTTLAITTTKYKNDVSPGTAGAQLILPDGSSVDLKDIDSGTSIADATIEGDGKALKYKEESAVTPKQVVYNTLVVPKANFFKIELSDGTKVWVNALSQLKFPVQFSQQERRVFLEGEAYFEVTKDTNRPFIVESNGSSIKVLGTHFNVNSYLRSVRTTLLEGKVEVAVGDQKMILLPGEYSASSEDGIKKGKADIKREMAWKNNEFYFAGDNIAQIAAELSRWYDLDVSFIGQISFDKVYSGSIERDVNLSQVLDMLSYVSHLDFDIEGKKLTIINRQQNKKNMEN